MILVNWILLLLIVNTMARISTIRSGGFSATIVFDEMEQLPRPLPPIDTNNTTDLLKMLPLPSQWPKHGKVTDNEEKKDIGTGESGLSKAAEWLRNSLNESVSPCEDFYEFTCGKWLFNNPIPTGEKYIYRISKMLEDTKHQIRDLFVDPRPSSSKAINMAKSMFGACLNYDRKKSFPLLERINEFGGWPILFGSQWDPEYFNLAHLLAKIKHSLGSCYRGSCKIFMEPRVEQRQHNASQQAIYIYQTQLGLGWPEFYKNETKLEEYAQRIMAMLKQLVSDAGIDYCDEKISHEINKIVHFEKKLANITKQKASLIVGRFSELVKIIPELNLTEYFKTLLPINESLHEYFASDPGVLYDDIYFGKLSSLLAETNKTTLANYVILRYVMEWSSRHLDDRLEPKKAEPIDKLDMDCVQWVENELRYATGAMYVRQHSGNGNKNAVLEMVENVRDTFRTMLGQNTWMDPVTKNRSLSKLDKVIPHIGYPDFYLQDSKLDAYYNGLKFDDNDSFSTMLEKTSNFNTVKEFQKLLAPTDRSEIDLVVYGISAYYEKTKNLIYIPPAYIQTPFFDKSFPKAVTYGRIGFMIGHEFTHGFDDKLGSKYDEIGNERDWWEPETKTNFAKQKGWISMQQCLIDQYSAYRLPELNMAVNGTFTAAENQADNGGINEAYMAYKTYLKKQGGHEEQHLPGFENFTNEQLFFINFGSVWCINESKQQLKWHLSHDPHTPSRYMVNAPLQNLPEFAAAFDCPKGSPMNPEKKCRIW